MEKPQRPGSRRGESPVLESRREQHQEPRETELPVAPVRINIWAPFRPQLALVFTSLMEFTVNLPKAGNPAPHRVTPSHRNG